MRSFFLLSSALLALVGTHADAASIKLWNTGVDSGGNVLALDGIDTHYSLVNPPSPFTTATYAKDSSGGYPIIPGVWVADNTSSRWIVPSPNYFFGDIPGQTDTLTYRTSFDLTGFDPSTALITGRWAVDDSGFGLRINGLAVTGFTPANYAGWTSFSIASGFVSGLNVLEFDTRSTVAPTGLRVEMQGMAEAAVPEPGTWAMMIVGFGLMGAAVRRQPGVRVAYG